MKLKEKLAYLQDNYYVEWLKTQSEVRNELSSRNELFCVCGRLATGLHESNCRKFSKKIINETVKRLKHLIKK